MDFHGDHGCHFDCVYLLSHYSIVTLAGNLGYLDLWISGELNICIFGYVDFWISGYLDIWISGYLEMWISGYLNIWILVKNNLLLHPHFEILCGAALSGGFFQEQTHHWFCNHKQCFLNFT